MIEVRGSPPSRARGQMSALKSKSAFDNYYHRCDSMIPVYPLSRSHRLEDAFETAKSESCQVLDLPSAGGYVIAPRTTSTTHDTNRLATTRRFDACLVRPISC